MPLTQVGQNFPFRKEKDKKKKIIVGNLVLRNVDGHKTLSGGSEHIILNFTFTAQNCVP